MENNNRHGRNTAAVAFLIGAVAGGVTALLLAPQTGAQMRKRLKRGAHDLQERGEHLAHEMSDNASALSGAVKGAAFEARNTYRDEREKRRTAAAADPKRFGDTETAESKPRTTVPSQG